MQKISSSESVMASKPRVPMAEHLKEEEQSVRECSD